MQITTLKRVFFSMLANADDAILAAVRPSREYKNGVAGEIDGTKVDVILYANVWDKLTVKLPGKFDFPITQEELSAFNEKKHFIYVSFVDFDAKTYTRPTGNNSLEVTATAKDIILLNDPRNNGDDLAPIIPSDF